MKLKVQLIPTKKMAQLHGSWMKNLNVLQQHIGYKSVNYIFHKGACDGRLFSSWSNIWSEIEDTIQCQDI
jgi:hypothetical protein